MKMNRPNRIFGVLASIILALSLLAPNTAYAEDSSDKAETGKYTLTFSTSFNMCEVYYHIQDINGNEIFNGSVDELSTSVEGWKTYDREIWLEEAPATISFSGRCYSSYPGSSGEIPVCLDDTDPAEFKECSGITVSNYSTILDTDYNWGSYSIKKVDGTDDQSHVLTGDELNWTVIRMKPSFGSGKALNIDQNGYGEGWARQNVVHLYNIGDSSRFLLTKADEDSYYIDFYDGSGHYKVHEKRFDIDDKDGYDNEGNKVHVVTENRTDMNKRWQFIQRPNGYYLVRNKASGLYWALEKDNTNDGNVVVQKSLNNCHTWKMEIIQCFDPDKPVNTLKKYDTFSYMDSGDGSLNGCNWMSHLPDNMNIADISIPGSHDSGTAKTTTLLNSSAQCQQHTIQEQLNAGVRYFDIRIEKDGDELYITHGGVDCYYGDEHLKFSKVMDWVDGFLKENPKETVILQIMVQKGGKDAEQMTLNKMKNWSRVYRGENWKDPVMPELGDLRGKVMFISRFSDISGIGQSTFRDGEKWFGLDAHDWKQGKDHTFDRAASSENLEIWTQDKYSLSGNDKMSWVEGSIFDSKTGAVAKRNDVRKKGKKGLIISYTSCTRFSPQGAARYVHERLLPLLHERYGQTDPFVGIVCNDFIDEELSREIYSKNFKGINVTVRGMTLDGKTTADELNYYFTSGTSVGNFFVSEGNGQVKEHFTSEGYEPLCYGGGIPLYLDSKPNSFKDNWAAMSDAEVNMYGISSVSGNYILYVPLVAEGEENATVTFDVHGHGTAPEAVAVKKGGWLYEVPVLSAEGYTFGGWYYDPEYKKQFDESDPIYEDMTLHAKWTEGHTIKVEVVFPDNVEKPRSLTLTSYGYIPGNDPQYVNQEIDLDENNGWNGTFNLDPAQFLHIKCKDELKYDWYLITEKGTLPLKVHGISYGTDYGNSVLIDFHEDKEWENPDWTEKQRKAAYDSIVNGTAVVRMIYSDHFYAKMTWNSGAEVEYTACMYDGDPSVVPDVDYFSDPWENIMLTAGEPHEVVLEHRETSSKGEVIWKTVEVGKIYDHERDGIAAWNCAFDTPIVDKRANYRVRLKVNNRTGRDYGSQYILGKEDGKEKLIYDVDDEGAKGETNVFSFVFRDPRRDITNVEDRPGHRRTFKVTYGTDDQGYFTVHNERIGDFTAEIKWNLSGKYKSLKPEAVKLSLASKDGSQWNPSENQRLSEDNGWAARFIDGQWETIEDVRDHYCVMLGSSSDGDTVTLPVMDGEDKKNLDFTVNYDTSDGYHYVVSLTLNHIHAEPLEHIEKNEATCTEDGNIEYWRCSDCGGYFSNAEGTQEITEEDTIIKATGHTWGDWEVTVEPTEEQDGTKTRTCEKCGAVQTDTVPFEYVLRKVDEKPATCTEEGNIEYWIHDKSSKFFMDDSGQIEIQEGDVTIPALGHEWSKWTRVTETDNKGIHHIDSRTCLRDGCGEKEVFDYYENHAHELELQDEIPATCSDTGIREHYMCTVCGQLFEDKEGKIAIVDDGEDVPEADRKTVEEKLALTVDPDAHKWTVGITEKEPTCTEPGEQNLICLHNEAHNKSEEIEPLGHKWDNGVVTKEATETSTGVKTYTCEVCGDTKTETIPKKSSDESSDESTDTDSGSAKKVSGTLLAKMTAKGGRSLVISWTKVNNVDGYDVFFSKCGKNSKVKFTKTIKGNKTFKWTKKGLKKRTSYKVVVKAWVKKNGKKTYVKASPRVHAYTSGGTKKFTNPKKVTVKKTNVSLKVGKTYKIKASVTKLQKGKKLMPKGHDPKLRYLSSNKSVATVTKKGVVKAKAKGTCYINAYAQNGVSKKIKITVK